MNDPKKTTPPKQLKVVPLDRQMLVVRYSPDGKVLVAGGSDATVRRFDAEALTPLPSLSGHNGWVQCLAFHQGGKRLLTADSWGEVRCWPFAEREPKPLWTVKAHDGWVRGLSIAADGRLATGGADGKVCIWSAEGKKLHEFGHDAEVFAVAFHPDNKALVSGDLNGALRHWDVDKGRAVRDLDGKLFYNLSRLQEIAGLRCLAFDPKGTTLAAAGCQPTVGATVQGTPTVVYYDWATGKATQTVKTGTTNDAFIHDLAHHPSGYWMGVSSGLPGQGKLFFHRPGEASPFFTTAAMMNCQSLALHPGGTRLAVLSTNGGSNGNGRLLRNKEYPGNFTPLHLWQIG